MNADRLLSSAWPLSHFDSAPSRSLSTSDEMGCHEMIADGPHISTTLPPTNSNSALSRNLSTISMHVRLCYEHNLIFMGVTTPAIPVVSITLLLWELCPSGGGSRGVPGGSMEPPLGFWYTYLLRINNGLECPNEWTLTNNEKTH